MMKFFLRYWFLMGLVAAVGLALLWPGGADGEGWLAPDRLAKGAVAIIFFLRGLLLPLREVWRGVAAWRLHLLTQAYLFLLTPLAVLFLLNLWELVFPLSAELRLGFFFLAVLPTTISSAVVFTSQAHGNSVGAVFNATGSNLLGVIVVPLWLGWFEAVAARSFPVGPVVAEIALLLVAPLVLGQLARRWLGVLADRRKKSLETTSSLLLLLILYLVFARSVLNGVWENYAGWGLAGVLASCALLYSLLQTGAALLGKWARLPHGDYVSHFFCAPQKTLAAGAPMASVLFAGEPGLPLIILPMLFYHFVQLLVGGLFIERFRKKR